MFKSKGQFYKYLNSGMNVHELKKFYEKIEKSLEFFFKKIVEFINRKGWKEEYWKVFNRVGRGELI